MDSPILVALIGGGFSVVVALIHKLSRENRVDHGTVHRALGRIEQKIDSHLDDHGGQP